MMMKVNRKVNFQHRTNLEGKNERILNISCKECSEVKENFFKSHICTSCFLKNLNENRNKKFHSISIEKLDTLIETKEIKLFFEYFKKLKKLKKLYSRIENLKNNKCKFKEFKCNLFQDYSSFFRIDEEFYYNPILFYNFIQVKKLQTKKNEKKCKIHPPCQNCFNFINSTFEYMLNLIKHLEIIKNFDQFQTSNNFLQEISNFYEYLLSKHYKWTEKTPLIERRKSKDTEELLELYKIGEYKLFQVLIYNVLDETEKNYEVNLSLRSEPDKVYFKMIVEDILDKLNVAKLDTIVPLENLIELYKQESLKLINSKFNLPDIEKNKIAYYTSLKKLNLKKIFPLLIDDFIEEIFLDSPNDFIYINHQKYGRCRTFIKFSSEEIERIKTFLRLYSGLRLDFLNPSIKHVIKNKYFYCRFAIDIGPVNFNDFSLDIRKLNKNILTIQDLLKNNTLNPLMASFLYFCILRRINITVTGETDTGKTTLINALDLLTPKEFRKIYIENIIESLNQFEFDKHQLKYKVDSLEDSIKKKHSKSNQIKTLLHRSPDLIYLGEILTKEEAEAMFHCLAAGLRGFQTIHSNDINSLINRFLYHFKIDISCLNDLNLILLMKKEFNKRRIVSINEIDLNNLNTKKVYRTIFSYNPENHRWDNLASLYRTNTLSKLKVYEDLSLEKFSAIIEIYYDIFKGLSKIDKISNEELISFFHKVSYYSMSSIPILEDFWIKWKKKRGLNF